MLNVHGFRNDQVLVSKLGIGLQLQWIDSKGSSRSLWLVNGQVKNNGHYPIDANSKRRGQVYDQSYFTEKYGLTF